MHVLGVPSVIGRRRAIVDPGGLYGRLADGCEAWRVARALLPACFGTGFARMRARRCSGIAPSPFSSRISLEGPLQSANDADRLRRRRKPQPLLLSPWQAGRLQPVRLTLSAP